jgi:general secretion pathway protein J
MNRMRDGGFTLLEILIALAILAIVLTALFKTFQSTLGAIAAVDEETEVYRMARISMDLIGTDLRSTYWREDEPRTGFSGIDQGDGETASDTLQFGALVNQTLPSGGEGVALASVAYRLEPALEEDAAAAAEPGAPTLFYLMRDAAGAAGAAERADVGERVVSFNLRYFQDGAWHDSWDSAASKKIPEAVEVELVFQSAVGRDIPFKTIVEIPVGLP